MKEHQALCVQILCDADSLVADLKLLPSAVRCKIVSAIQRKLTQETDLVTPESCSDSDIEDDPDTFEQLEEEINIVVNENGDILELDQMTCDTATEGHRIVSSSDLSSLHDDFVDKNVWINNNRDSHSQIGTEYKRKRRIQKPKERSKVGVCPVCNKYIQYHNNNDFKNHLKLHTGERKYKCFECDKSFISQSRLTYHKNNVHDPPKYQCSFCEKLFRSKVSYERHILVHSDEKPHQCEFCSYKARTVGNLSSHVRAVHDIKDYTVGGKDKLVKRSDAASYQLFNPLISTNTLSQDLNNQCQELFINENVTLNFEEFVESGTSFTTIPISPK